MLLCGNWLGFGVAWHPSCNVYGHNLNRSYHMNTVTLSPAAYLALVAFLAGQWNARGTVGTGPNGSDGETFHGRPYRGAALVGNVLTRSDID
jgi:hypothetical protein